MKTNKLETESTKRNRYTPQFKEQALERAKRDGVPQVAKDLGIAPRCCMDGKPRTGKRANPSKIKSYNKRSLRDSNVRMPAWKKRSIF